MWVLLHFVYLNWWGCDMIKFNSYLSNGQLTHRCSLGFRVHQHSSKKQIERRKQLRTHLIIWIPFHVFILLPYMNDGNPYLEHSEKNVSKQFSFCNIWGLLYLLEILDFFSLNWWSCDLLKCKFLLVKWAAQLTQRWILGFGVQQHSSPKQIEKRK